jgi:purine-binding chemotaxis protein CheW
MAIKDIQKIIAQVAGDDSEKEAEKKKKNIQVVVFGLDQEEYAVEITDLQEIIKIPDITPIPNAPEFISGILNLRGKIVVVIDLEKRFSLVREDSQKAKHIIITEIEGSNYGVLVDQVNEVLRISEDSIQPTPDLVSAKINADYLSGVIVLDKKNKESAAKEDESGDVKSEDASRLIILLNLKKLLQEKELLQLGEIIKKKGK